MIQLGALNKQGALKNQTLRYYTIIVSINVPYRLVNNYVFPIQGTGLLPNLCSVITVHSGTVHCILLREGVQALCA